MLIVPLLELKQVLGVCVTELIAGELVLTTVVVMVNVHPFASVIKTL